MQKRGYIKVPISKTNMVKLTAAVYVAVQLLLSGCEGNGSNRSDPLIPGGTTEKSLLYSEPGLSKYDLPITLSFARENTDALEELMSQLSRETLEDNRWTRLYENVLGVKIKYDWTAWGDIYQRKLGVSLASGHIPDVVRVSASQLRMLSNAGLIHDLTEVYNKYATQLTKDVLNQEGTGPFDTATINGKLMAIPETSSSIERAMFIWIRTDWLDQLGLNPPQSMDEVLAISKAFTEMDPDQNGLRDTYGLALTKYLWDPVMGISGFMAGYEAYSNIWIKDENGNLVYGGIQPEVKTALKVLQDMYSTGQIDREFSYKDGVKSGKLISHGKIGMMYGEQWGSFMVQPSREPQPLFVRHQARSTL